VKARNIWEHRVCKLDAMGAGGNDLRVLSKISCIWFYSDWDGELVVIMVLEARPDGEEATVKILVRRGEACKSAIACIICTNAWWPNLSCSVRAGCDDLSHGTFFFIFLHFCAACT
jgi:hypothetical protein